MPDLILHLQKISDLKGLPAAERQESMAEKLFIQGASACLLLIDTHAMARLEILVDYLSMHGLSAMILGDFKEEMLGILPQRQLVTVQHRLLDAVLALMPDGMALIYRERFESLLKEIDALNAPMQQARSSNVPLQSRLQALCRHTRSGYARPGQAKLSFFPTESQADHSLTCPLYAPVLARLQAADWARSALMALFHQLPMAVAPDIDHGAEAIIGSALKAIIENAAMARILEPVSPHVRSWLMSLREEYLKGASREGRVVWEPDILDRAVQLSYYVQSMQMSAEEAIQECAFFDEGDMGDWEREVLGRYRLLPDTWRKNPHLVRTVPDRV